MSLAEKQALAEPWLQRAGYDPSQLELVTREGNPGSGMWIRNPRSAIPDWSTVSPSSRKLRSYEPSFRSRPPIPPMSTSRPKMPALTLAGYGLFTLILGILAIVYSVKTRAYVV